MSLGCCKRLLDLCCPSRRRPGRAPPPNGHDLSLNIILFGECAVGKTSLRNRWVDGVFTGDVAPTFGVDFNIKTLELVEDDDRDAERDVGDEQVHQGKDIVKGEDVGQRASATEHGSRKASRAALQVKINVYDTSGKSGFREVNSTYLLAFDGVLFVYDISAVSTLDVSIIRIRAMLKDRSGSMDPRRKIFVNVMWAESTSVALN